jgi:adhesin HecA-like repeat protein
VAQGVDNSGGTIAGNGALDVQAGELINRTGTLSGAGTADSTLQIVGALDNHEGTIASNANRLTVAAARLDNSGGSIRQAGNQGLDITTGRLDGSKGTLVSSATLTCAPTTWIIVTRRWAPIASTLRPPRSTTPVAASLPAAKAPAASRRRRWAMPVARWPAMAT